MEDQDLANFDNLQGSYKSSINSSIQNILSSEQFGISEKKTVGEGYTEIGSLAELTVPSLLKYGGISKIKNQLADLDTSDIGNNILDNASDILGQAKQGLSNAIDSFSNTVDSFMQNQSVIERPSELTTGGESIEMDNLNNNPSQLTTFESNEFTNPVYDPKQLDEPTTDIINPSTEDNLATNLTEKVGGDVSLDTAGETVGETVGLGVADALGVGEAASLILGLAGLAGGGYSLFKGFEDIFSDARPKMPNFQNVAIPDFEAT